MNQNQMVEEALDRIKDDQDKQIQFISVRDSGSRSRNMDGPHSDIDAFGIFIQPLIDYAKPSGYLDTIDTNKMVEGEEIDFHGWNIRKFADLTRKSNPQAIEFLKSHIVYYQPDRYKETIEDFTDHALNNVNLIGAYYHHRSMGEANYYKYLVETVNDRHDPDGSPDRFLIKRKMAPYMYIVEDLESGDTFQANTSRGGEYDLSTTDRRIKKCLNVFRTILICRYIREEKRLPSWDFEYFLNEEAITTEEEFTVAHNLLQLKRDGRADEEFSEESFKPINEAVREELTVDVDNESLNGDHLSHTVVNTLVDDIFRKRAPF